MELFGQTVTASAGIFLLIALALALGFEFVNGFHDTANAVATVIYTKSLKPVPAVVWSGCWNLIGVLTSLGTVAFGILALLPADLVTNAGSGASYAMVFALLISAIIWNVGTWFLGLPASSSHTMIGAILGVGVAYALSHGQSIEQGLNWTQVQNVFTALLLSPIVGFLGSAGLLLLGKALIKEPKLFQPPDGDKAPPLWIRILLILTCTGVSYSHGSNDGQKGMGLLLLILIGTVPGAFAVKLDTTQRDVSQIAVSSRAVSAQFQTLAPGLTLTTDAAKAELKKFLKNDGKASPTTYAAIARRSSDIATLLDGKSDFNALSVPQRTTLRSEASQVADSIGKLDKKKTLPKDVLKTPDAYEKSLNGITKYIPLWIKIAVALALGIGTMVGWKRIVVTVGEKIGKEHMTYGQGASAELVAMATIGLATQFGLPVSTTHVLSSGVAGTMWANKSGLQGNTLRNIVLAWVLTLPVCILLGATMFSAALYLVFHVMHIP